MAPLHAITLDNVDEIVDNLYLGGITAAYETNNLVEQGIRAVVCCVRETEFPSSEFNTKIEYFRVDVEDVSREPIEYFWPEATQFIHDHHSKGLPVFVHCRAGVSRSASTVIAYLMCHLGFTLKDAFLLAHRKRPVVTPNLGFMDKLSQLEKSIKGAGSIDLFKYESWWSGSHMAEVPDVGFGDSTEVEVEAESPSTAGPGSPGMKQSRSSGALKLQAASRKLKVLRAMSSFDHRHQVDMDVPKLMDDPRSDPVHRQRLERIRWLLMRQAAHDPELAYCQGMHLSAAVFVAASETKHEAYWRFHAFTNALRGLWLADFPLLQSGCTCFRELAAGRPWFQKLCSYKFEPETYLAQAWLGVFGLWLPLPVIVQCIQLLEGSHMAGILSMTLALMDRRSDRLMEADEDGLLKILCGKEDISARELLQDTRKHLAEASIALKRAKTSEVELHLSLEDSRVLSSGAKILDVLPSLAELVLHDVVEPAAAPAAAPIPAPVAAQTDTCQCWSCLEQVLFPKPYENILSKRAMASVRDQKLELAKMQSHTQAVIKHEARNRLSRLNWASHA